MKCARVGLCVPEFEGVVAGGVFVAEEGEGVAAAGGEFVGAFVVAAVGVDQGGAEAAFGGDVFAVGVLQAPVELGVGVAAVAVDVLEVKEGVLAGAGVKGVSVGGPWGL